VVLKNIPFLLADTVGFIRKLPHTLVDSFKSTLEEVREADLLIHVVDVTHPHFEDHIDVVNQTLNEIGASDIPVIMVFNKIDAFEYIPKDEFDLTPIERENYSLDDLKKTWMANIEANQTLFISATAKANISKFKEVLYDEVKKIHDIRYPYNAYLY
jgi:GTP-binding protein HflX